MNENILKAIEEIKNLPDMASLNDWIAANESLASDFIIGAILSSKKMELAGLTIDRLDKMVVRAEESGEEKATRYAGTFIRDSIAHNAVSKLLAELRNKGVLTAAGTLTVSWNGNAMGKDAKVIPAAAHVKFRPDLAEFEYSVRNSVSVRIRGAKVDENGNKLPRKPRIKKAAEKLAEAK